jgi:hypothetical protein
MLSDIAPDALHGYVRVIWFEGKRSGWACMQGSMNDLIYALLSGDIAAPCVGFITRALSLSA